MAEETKTLDHGMVDPAKANADVARKLEDQKLDGLSSPDEFADTATALDALRAEKSAKADDTGVVTPKADADKPVEDAPADDTKPVVDTKPVTETKPATGTPSDIFSDVQLPPNARPNSASAFATVKERALTEIAAREKTIEDLKRNVAELDAKVKATPTIPPEVEAELTDLRQWRAKLDIDADPQFKEFDKTIASTEEFIYAQLKRSPKVSDAMIEQIKGLGGPANVNLTRLFEHLQDPTLQRIVESKVADIEVQKFTREQAIKATKANVQGYLKEREEKFKQAATGHNDATRKELEGIISKSSWFQKKQAKDDATPDERAQIDAANKVIDEVRQELELGLQDDSPRMRAIMLTGMAKCFWLQSANEAKEAKIKELTSQVTDLTTKLNKVRASSTTRIRDTAARDDAATAVPAKSDDDGYGFGSNARGTTAIDQLASRIMQEKRAAANA